jgi:hypothetical protein
MQANLRVPASGRVIVLVAAVALMVDRGAGAETLRFDCTNAETSITHFVEVDTVSQTVRRWYREAALIPSDVYGPFPASISAARITFVDRYEGVGGTISNAYVVDRVLFTLTMTSSLNWRMTTPCKTDVGTREPR